jgi:hypothetical protein
MSQISYRILVCLSVSATSTGLENTSLLCYGLNNIRKKFVIRDKLILFQRQ